MPESRTNSQNHAVNQVPRSLGTILAVLLLAVAAAASALVGALAPVVGLAAGEFLGGSLGSVATAVLIALGVSSLLFAAAPGSAARMVYSGQSAGTVMGVTIGVILLAAPAIASASGGWHPGLVASIAMGAGIVGSLTIGRQPAAG